MQRRKLRKYRIMQDFCVVTGVIGAVILFTTSEVLPMDVILTQGVSGITIMCLSYIAHRFLKGYEKYKILQQKRVQGNENSACTH